MKNLLIYLIVFGSLFSIISCKKDEPTFEENSVIVNQFIYDGLATYYLWADEVEGKKPNTNDNDSKIYFSKLLNSTDKSKGWSFITDDVEGLLADFAGEPKEFGFDVALTKNREFILIRYVYPNSPADKAGLKRLDLIGKINGVAVDKADLSALFDINPLTFTKYRMNKENIIEEIGNVTVSPEIIKTDPVLYTTVFSENEKKIGYIFYTGFITNYNSSLFNAFEDFKNKGVTDLVLDLRYNRGGSVSAAVYLASLIAPKNVVNEKKTLVKMSYNNFLNNYFKTEKINTSYNFGEYSKNEKNPSEVNLNLDKVYIIATGGSYSASELTTFCLKPYLNVVHIGGNTGGKYTASRTLHGYENKINSSSVVPIYDKSKLSSTKKIVLKSWAMQPIVAKYTNCNDEDFSNDGYLIPNYSLEEGFGYLSNWRQIGSKEDVFLGQALYLITNNFNYKPKDNTQSNVKILRTKSDNSVEIKSPKDALKNSVLIDKIAVPNLFLDRE